MTQRDGVKHNLSDHDVLDSDQAACFLQITPRTLREWRSKRGLPHWKVTAKEIRYSRADLAGWLERFRQGVAL
ncbi:MAG TPA: DNA-binding protein [Verrucomicrobiales bacterium]|nr:DNA-binding protein [Verrucomicrobiales bacterium]